MSLPFYQKHHKHYDRGYRSTEVQSALSQYHLDEQSSTTSRSKGSRVALYSDEVLVESSSKLSPRPKRPRPTYTALDHEIIGYVVPVFRGRREYISGITDTEEERIKETAGYLARRNLFTTGESVTAISRSTVDTVGEKMFEKKSRKTAMRESAEHINLNKKIHETMEFHRKLNKDSLLHAPEFVIKPRSHTVWEKQNVKLHCTVSGWPEPRVTWYKNNVPIEVDAYPGKYKIESRYSVHSLEIYSCDFDDTAQYRASAMNVKGEVSTISSIVVKRYKEEMDSSSLGTVSLPLSYGLSTTDYGTKFNIHIVEKFAVSFGREGETMSLGCTVIVYPNMKRIQPEIQWYRDGVLLQPSKWVQMHWSGNRATLTLTHLNKEDEGLYTMRVVTKSDYETYSAYVFVRDAEAEVAGAPAAPLDVECLDANKDYVIVTWKQPAVDRGSPILGYFVDRCEVGTTHWSQCNDTPFKFARFPVTGLVEGRSYTFRVRAVNKNGISRPSRVSNPIAAMDPADKARMKGHPSAPWTGQIIVTEEEPAEGVVPGKPCQLAVTEATKSYVVLSWKPPGQRGHEGIMYYVEKWEKAKELIGYYIEATVVGSGVWEPCNNKPVKGTRFFCHGLSTGQTYIFRVRAVNAAGLSEFSQESEAIEVKAAIGKHGASQPSPDTLLKRDAQVNRDMLPASLESLAPCPKVSKDKEANEGTLPAAPIASKKVDVEQTSKSELEGSTKKDKMKQRKDSGEI
ncbi:Myomesin-1 [Acipenser ruthenus]|uniref:Myomesin-1 n=1 Tax=Acipenser ruthenus TaxID=7906 RepID=A0A444UPF5_ACIRT|nr:Myomesin-1 [Acipenser ruthenus]